MGKNVRFLLMLTCFISLHTTSCTRYGGLGIKKLGRNVSDGYNTFSRREFAVGGDVSIRNGSNICAQTYNAYQYN